MNFLMLVVRGSHLGRHLEYLKLLKDLQVETTLNLVINIQNMNNQQRKKNYIRELGATPLVLGL